MYQIKWNFKTVISILIILIILYGAELFSVWTGFSLYHKKISWLGYTIPIFILILFGLLILIGMCWCECLYSTSFFIFGLFLGYLLYSFLTSIIFRIIIACIDVPEIIGLPILVGVPFLVCVYGYINAKVTRVVKISLKYEGFKGSVTTILHLTDIHLGTIHQKSSIEKIVKEAEQLKPDIIVITGDMADGSLQVKEEWLKPFDQLTMPILYITGNHEMMNPKLPMINEVNKTKIKHIGNYGNFNFNGINFIGIDFDLDLNDGLKQITQQEGIPNVLLSHIPTMRPEELEKYNVFLFLAGHTHGGQIFPFHIPAYAMNKCFSGLYSDKDNKHYVYVSDGVNNAVVPMRVGSKRVFALITITGNDENDS